VERKEPDWADGEGSDIAEGHVSEAGEGWSDRRIVRAPHTSPSLIDAATVGVVAGVLHHDHARALRRDRGVDAFEQEVALVGSPLPTMSRMRRREMLTVLRSAAVLTPEGSGARRGKAQDGAAY
jgi:hypothetical protein